MNRYFLFLLALLPCAGLQAQTQVKLPNGWSISPTGRSLPLGDFPLNMAVSTRKGGGPTLLAVTNNGQSKQTIQLFDATAERLLDEIPIAKSWVGLRFSPDRGDGPGQKLFASGGNDNRVMVYSVANNKLVATDSIVLGKAWPNRMSVAGIELSADGNTLYAVTKDDSALYVANVQTGRVTQRIQLPHEAYTCLRHPVTNQLYISLWGGSAVLVYDPQQGKITERITVGEHPNDLLFGGKNNRYLFVANANDNSVSIVDLSTRKVVETLNTALYPDAPIGSTPNGLALSSDQKSLLVANADNNCLAVFDVAKPGRSRSLGFIPTGWYPTAVKVIGKKVFVSNGKGMTSLPNPKGPNPFKGRDNPGQYIGSMFTGTMSVFEMPAEKQLAGLTRQVYANTPYSKEREKLAEGEANSPIPRSVDQKSPIKYVFYIIKENRTYDQVFGDMKGGNGDSSLCLFPEKITPNQHALAREFGLIDNFYVDAEVSADGHNWSTAAYAPDFVEKTWPTSYGGRGGTYDYEGSRPVAYPKKGFIWDHAKRAGVSYRGYGEFAAYARRKGSALDGRFCFKYPDYDLKIKDVDRVEIWKADLDSLIKANRAGGPAVPRLNTLRLGNDHTAGARIGQLTPLAMVADNDLAVGRFVEHLSNSPIWNESAVFILEDDAQNGADHVDAHRSPALVISPYAKRQHVEHTMYSTSGMLRTMELILGMPPMSQYDAAARPMFALFTNTPNTKPYKHIPANIDLDAKNTAMNEPARRSEKFDLRHADTLDDAEFNAVIWMAIRGENSPVPAPRRGAWLRIMEADDDDD